MEMDDYDVYDETEGTNNYIGSVELPINSIWQDMPTVLEINGYIYVLEV